MAFLDSVSECVISQRLYVTIPLCMIWMLLYFETCISNFFKINFYNLAPLKSQKHSRKGG